MRIFASNKNRTSYLILIILLFNIIFYSILFANSNLINNPERINNDSDSLIHTSALEPPQIESYETTKTLYSTYNFDLDMPSYHPDGNLYIAQIAMDGDESFSSTPSGWTEIENGYYNGYMYNDVRFATYWKIGDSEPASYRWSCAIQRYWVGAIYRISGYDTNNPIDTSSISTYYSTYPRAPSLTTTVDQCLILRLFGADDNNVYSTYWPSGTTPLFQDNCGYDTVMSAAAYHVKATAGSLSYAQFRMSYSAGWVGVSIAIAPLPDTTPPVYSDLYESADPLELGDTETIRINATDASGVNQVLLEFEGSNHSMTYISGDMWEYDSWTPSSVGSKPYTVWIEDTNNNWNSTSGSISVEDSIAPTYSDLIESADPLQIGGNETITIKAYDSPGSGINQVLLEYGGSNHTMSFIGENTWSWGNWKPSVGAHNYSIFISDNQNNWNTTGICNITVISTTAPLIGNLTENGKDPLELGDFITISVDAVDEQTSVSAVLIKLDNIYYDMTHVSGNTYEINWTKEAVGIVIYTIYANDTENNLNSLTSSFDIVDTTKPIFTFLNESKDILELGDTIVISVNATDLSGIYRTRVEYDGINHTMGIIGIDSWQSDPWTPEQTGLNIYTIWVEDNNNNWNFTNGNITVYDTISPYFSNLTVPQIVELGDNVLITILVSDLSGIKRVLIEYEESNHSMANVGGDQWQYDTWSPDLAKNYSYKIYIEDNNKNYNYTSGSINFQDTTSPTYSDLDAPGTLELGEAADISININDIGGINLTLIEFEGVNHTMNNIPGTTLWQYNTWVPDNWILYNYTIYMEDRSGNSNLVSANFTVYDTIPPGPPTFTNAPSGDVSGILTFDWNDGYDPSGISYYILLIDNDPNSTNGFVYYYNITNTGLESSFFEFTEPLANGRYYYFLYQVDGVGHQSGYAMGTFSIVSLVDPSLMNLIIIIVIIGSLIGVSLTIIVAKKRMKKEITPPREKIPLKGIISHIERISNSDPTSGKNKISKKKERTENPSKKDQSIDDEILNNRIEKIRNFGKELFAEGAYLEAQKQYEFAEKVLLRLGREEEALKFSDLKISIKELTEAREKKLELLEEVKAGKDSIRIFELYNDLIEISLRLKDDDTADMYKSELVQIFQTDKVKLKDLEYHRFKFYQKANSLLEEESFEKSAEIYGKCENISLFLIELGKINEAVNVEKFRYKINECLKKASQINSNMR